MRGEVTWDEEEEVVLSDVDGGTGGGRETVVHGG
jgi:hypothetical protein